MTHSQENVTDLPERVLLVASGPQKSSGHFYLSTSGETGAAIYVPEQRALDAERERDALIGATDQTVRDYLSRKNDRLKEQLAAAEADLEKLRGDILAADAAVVMASQESNALRYKLEQAEAERDAALRDLRALVPLARAALHSWNYVWAKQADPDTQVPQLTLTKMEVAAARVVLARHTEGREG